MAVRLPARFGRQRGRRHHRAHHGPLQGGVPGRSGPRRRPHAGPGRHAGQGRPLPPRDRRTGRPTPAVGRPAPPAGARARLHHLLAPGARRDLLRRLARAADGPARSPHHLPPAGRDGRPGPDRPVRRRRPRGPGRLVQGPLRAPLRRRRPQRGPPPAVRRADRAGRALTRRLPFGGPPGHPHRGRSCGTTAHRSASSTWSSSCIRPRRSGARPGTRLWRPSPPWSGIAGATGPARSAGPTPTGTASG